MKTHLITFNKFCKTINVRFDCTSLRRLNKTLYKDMLPYLSGEISSFYTNSLRHCTNLIQKSKPKSTLNIIFILKEITLIIKIKSLIALCINCHQCVLYWN